MRLSTAPDRDEAGAVAVLHAALDAGVSFLDTADAYALDDREIGHNERLIARALATWPGDRARVEVATKGGLTRPGGRWVPDGRARHLREACEASRRALGVDRIALYQLHAPDPTLPLATSVRALDQLRRDGLVAAIGLCNVSRRELEEARKITEIDAVQVELSVWDDSAILSGVVAYCIAHGIRVIAYRPFGGPAKKAKLLADPVLSAVAEAHGATPHEVALAWLHDLAEQIVTVPGATRLETARSVGRAARIQLTDDERARLDARLSSVAAVRSPATTPAPARRADGEVVLVMGLPASGKSTVAHEFVEQGYTRLNRDEAGGSLADLIPALDRAVESGISRVVLDNTYTTRKTRAPILASAARHGLPVRGVWLETSMDDAQVNAVWRMVTRYGRLLEPGEMRRSRDPGAFGPAVLYRYQRELEPPQTDEGFATIEVRPFTRTSDPARTSRAVVLWCSDEILEAHGELLQRYEREGWKILRLSWQPGLATGTLTPPDLDTAFAQAAQRLGVSMDVRWCPHPEGPPVCWCRKPLPGLGVVMIHAHALDPARSVYVGTRPQDPGYARRLGFVYRDAAAFFRPDSDMLRT
jgi:aryl-alcohol dehydrogenase-like predicted oxidoreductase